MNTKMNERMVWAAAISIGTVWGCLLSSLGKLTVWESAFVAAISTAMIYMLYVIARKIIETKKEEENGRD